MEDLIHILEKIYELTQDPNLSEHLRSVKSGRRFNDFHTLWKMIDIYLDKFELHQHELLKNLLPDLIL